MIFALNLLLMIVILCVVAWMASLIAAKLNAPPEVQTIIWVIVLIVLLIWLINLAGGGIVIFR